MSTLLDRLGRALCLVSLGLLGFSLVQWMDARAWQKAGFESIAAMTGEAESRPDSSPAKVERSDIVGRIDIPAVGISAVVGEGIDAGMLNRGVGHLPETDLPGESGNTVFAGHRDTFFAGLRDIARGDTILVTTTGGTFRYCVDDVNVVEPRDVEVLADQSRSTLTLVTCYPFRFIGPAPRRFVVRGALLADSSPTDPGRPQAAR